MELFYLVIFFIVGIIFGSIANRIGKYLPYYENIFQKEKCPNCKNPLPRVSFISYFRNSGRCKECKKPLSKLSICNQLFSGLLFAFSYQIFGLNYTLPIALGLVLLLIIIIVSDLNYLIISDEVLITFSLYFITIFLINIGLVGTFKKILSGLLLFGIMYLILVLGNYLLKKDSLGGGDVKLMFIFGLILGPLVGLYSLFLASFIALPFSLVVMHCKKETQIPFGPFLMLSLVFLYFMKIDSNFIINLLTI